MGIRIALYALLLAGCGSEPTVGGPVPMFEGTIIIQRIANFQEGGLYRLAATGIVTPYAPATVMTGLTLAAVASNGTLAAHHVSAGIVLIDPRNGGTVLDTIPQECCGSVHLAISPDGEQVAYWDGWNRELKAVRRDGTFARVLEARPDIRAPQFARVTWAGPERVLAVQWGRTAEGHPSGTAEVVEYDLRLGGARRMLEPLRDIPSAMAPSDLSANLDGTILAWSVQDGQRPAKIRVADAEGRVLRTVEIIEPAIGVGLGQVSPDGQYAVFAVDLDQPCHTCVAIVNLQTGATKLVDTGILSSYPRAWLPE